MKKSDLKTGMIVESKEGDLSIVMLDCTNTSNLKDLIISSTGWDSLNNYNEDLLNEYNHKDLDIVKIYITNNKNIYVMDNLTLLWERTSEKIIEFDGVEYSESTLRSLIKKATK